MHFTLNVFYFSCATIDCPKLMDADLFNAKECNKKVRWIIKKNHTKW